jgi:BatD DUF11 like domain
MRRILPATLLSMALLGAALSASAQSIHWDPPGGVLPVGEVSSLQLVFDDCSPEDVPAPPKVDGLRMDYQGQSSQVSIINGTFSKNVSMAFAVLLSKKDDVDIPGFMVNTNKGQIRVAGVHFAASSATVGTTGISLGDAVTARLVPSEGSVWAGEVFDLKYTIDAASSYYPGWGHSTFEWDPSPLVSEDWSQPEPYESNSRTGLSYHTRAMAPTAGRIPLNTTSQLINLSVGVSGFGFFQQRQYQQFAVPGAPVSLQVRPLPPAPSGFSGAVGDFKITSKIVPVQVKAGEPITWTVELSGSGNWPEIRALPSREAPADFQVIQPKPKRTQPAGKIFEATLTEDVVLVPTKEGSYELPPLDFTFFDPKSGTYRTVTAPGGHVEAEAAASAPAGLAQLPAAPGVPAITTSAPTTEARAPDQPTSGLGDPVRGPGSATLPLRKRTVAIACASPLGLLALLWAGLAFRRARATDPLKPRRDARRRLASTLGALSTAPSPEKAALLLRWQKDSALLWGIEKAAPPASTIDDAEWSALWSETDRFLYSATPQLAPDWVARAHAALAKKTLRSFSPFTLLLPRNLFPVLALGLLVGASALHAADGASSYRSGDFAAAEKSWASQVNTGPLDWAARHNLSLALAQQDRWGEATAHAASAFIQNPSEPATRRQLSVAGDKAGFVPEPLDILIQQGPLQSLARLQSPGSWQVAGILFACLLAVALALVLLASYGIIRRSWATPAASVLFAAAVIGGTASLIGFRAYGVTADTRSVIAWRGGVLRSVPTEADVTQKTITLSAGSTAIVDKSFLRWIRLSFPNGQTGWVLDSEVVYLWQAPRGASAAPASSSPSSP